MSNEDIGKKINEIYKADIGSIRNLSKLANDLTKNGKLVVPGGLEVKGLVKIEKGLSVGDSADFGVNSGRKLRINSSKHGSEQTYLGFYNGNTRTNYLLPKTNGELYNSQSMHIGKNLKIDKQTTINELYGGKSSINGFRSIKVNGSHLMFDIGNHGYGFHSNGNMYHKNGNKYDTHNFFGRVQGSNLKTGYRLLHYQFGDNATYDTKYSSNDWVLTVAGVNIDWNNRDPGAYKVYTFISGGKWYLRSEIESARDSSGIIVLAIPRANFDSVTTHRVKSGAGY